MTFGLESGHRLPLPTNMGATLVLGASSDAGSGKPSDRSWAGYLDALPRSVRGYQTVNLYASISTVFRSSFQLMSPTVIEFIFVFKISKLLKVDFVAEHGSDATKAFNKLIAFTRTIGYKLQGSAKVFVLLCKPF